MNYFKLSLIFLYISSISGQDRKESSVTDNTKNDVSSIQEIESKEKVLSRKKRYLIFPTGSSFSVAVCSTIGIYGNPQFSIFSWGVNWGFAYDLPTNASHYSRESETNALSRVERSVATKPMIQRRNRRDLFNRMEIAMNQMGYDGRECILRSLCEAPQLFGKKGKHLIAELIRTVFTFPKSKVLPFEPPELRIYDEAHRIGKTKSHTQGECHKIYPNCGFSLIKLALGKYSQPLQSYM